MSSAEHERISLIVCTRDRLSKLQLAMQGLLALRCPVLWQLIVVDNGSRDGSWEWLKALERPAGLHLDVLQEARRGISHARNTGLRRARGEIIAFTDDDCYPGESLLEELLAAFESGEVDYCGGRILLYDPTELPVSIRTGTSTERLAPHSFIVPGVISGANMAFRRSVLERVGEFDVLLGAGAPTRAGEDTDLLFRCAASGCTGMYLPALVVRHHHGRRTAEDRRGIETAYAMGRGAYYVKHACHRSTRMLMLKNWYWRTSLRTAAGRWRLRQELRGAAVYLWHKHRERPPARLLPPEFAPP